MSFSVSPAQLVKAYGLGNMVYFPRNEIADFDDRTAIFLSSVGLPHSEAFSSRMDVEDPYDPDMDAITLGSRFDLYNMTCPAESRSWWKLGYLFTSLITIAPKSGKVFFFPEGATDYVELHRDVESLVYALIEFRKLEVDHDNDVDPEELSERFRQVVSAFDPTPFADEDSQWNLSLTELEDGIW
ncbi:SUKH-4 family immunity protein [Streptomyces somaliensis DSM 40738]|uniref:SUKH-4 immunity protein n=1 Tax=Streptomyces somaliensis (strain ATCC 33201 / DSM 40738 / JCM 12659 / KCTC 9044 / NCTC 11332 / NRRL B-12077 / IP 733) TaxID=1134445 RepID=A0AA44DDD3_STRE0|nr:SUKH-4 family immunity protein [Streptomyces somaliensis]MCQ0022518.1 SUKH-4 family immunity protein [Streptomyces somaliensis DSM 40738]NKY14325.1 hypothetical protein [Streptomyces somaliensis DSM 40738]